MLDSDGEQLVTYNHIAKNYTYFEVSGGASVLSYSVLIKNIAESIMPTPSTSNLPKPKSWDEFEDIVWEIYTRIWQDSYAQRYGRSGQVQNGIDIYGRLKNSDNYVGIQCKRYEDNRLNWRTILAEVAKAECFSSPISEYIIATTASRDTKIQDNVRLLNEKRKSESKFPVYIIFWEDICNHLADQTNQDLLQKYYSEWGRIFQNTEKSRNVKRKRWRNFQLINFPVLSNSDESKRMFICYLAKSLKIVFENTGYTEFVSLISQLNTKITHPVVVYQLVSHKAQFCHIVQNLYNELIKNVIEIKSAGFSEDEEAEFKKEMEDQLRLDGWTTNINLALTFQPIAHKFIFDPDTKSISIAPITKSVWKQEPSTSDLMILLSCMINSHFAIIEGIELLYKLPKLMRLYINFLDRNMINYNDFRVNVDDDEEWDYLAFPKED